MGKDDDERTTAIGLARYAREYYEAALAVDDVLGKWKQYAELAPPPAMHLVAHSIELALKAWIMKQKSENDREKTYNDKCPNRQQRTSSHPALWVAQGINCYLADNVL